MELSNSGVEECQERKKNVPDHEELWNSMKKYCFNSVNIDEKIIKHQPCEAMIITNTTSQFSENQFLLEFIIYNGYYYHCIQDISYIMSTSEKWGNDHCFTIIASKTFHASCQHQKNEVITIAIRKPADVNCNL